MPIITYKFKILPSISQCEKLNNLFESCRFLFNCTKEYDQYRYKNKLKSNSSIIEKEIKLIKEQFSEYSNIHFHLLSNIIQHYFKLKQKSFQEFKKTGRFKLPRFKSYNRLNTLSFKEYGNGCKLLNNNRIKFDSFIFKFIKHRDIDGKIKYISLTRDNLNNFYILVTSEIDKSFTKSNKNILNNYDNLKIKSKKIDKIVGIDLGLQNYVQCSDNTIYNKPKIYKIYHDKIAKIQAKLSNQIKNSNRYNKTKAKLQKVYNKVSNIRKDLYHKISKDIINTYEIIILEKLEIQKMMRNNYRSMNRAISDACWSKLINYISYKAENAGKTVIQVNPAYTSQICSNCGNKKKKELEDREHKCEICGIKLSRDLNAAINIKNNGIKFIRMDDPFGLSREAPSKLRLVGERSPIYHTITGITNLPWLL